MGIQHTFASEMTPALRWEKSTENPLQSYDRSDMGTPKKDAEKTTCGNMKAHWLKPREKKGGGTHMLLTNFDHRFWHTVASSLFIFIFLPFGPLEKPLKRTSEEVPSELDYKGRFQACEAAVTAWPTTWNTSYNIQYDEATFFFFFCWSPIQTPWGFWSYLKANKKQLQRGLLNRSVYNCSVVARRAGSSKLPARRLQWMG